MFQPQEIQISMCLESMLNVRFCVFLKNGRSRVLFMGLTRMEFSKKKTLKIGSHGTIYKFKNYFATVFSVFSNKRYPNIP